MTILDRYIFRSFVEPFLMCFAGFIAIWLIIDVSDNFNDFLEAHASFHTIADYYITQIPAAVIMSMPVALMLALLFSLSRMSRTNEIVSQLTAGRSLVRMLWPLFAVGLAATGLCFWLNIERAPHSEGIKKVAMNKIRRGKKATDVEPVLAHLFRDRLNNRTWYVRKLQIGANNPDVNDLEDVHVTQQDATGRILKKWYGADFVYNPAKKEWVVNRGMIVEFTPEGDIADVDRFPRSIRVIKDWTETPWRVASSELNPSTLGIRELIDYVHFNYDFPAVQLAPYRANIADRFGLPLQCLIAVLIAAPLGVVYNRRGVIGGVTASIVLLVIMLMSHSFFLILGKGMRLNPYFSPWIPDIALGFVGFVLLWYRSTNRDFPKFNDAASLGALASFLGLLLVGGGSYFLLRHFPQSAQIPRLFWKNIPFNFVYGGCALMIYGLMARRSYLKAIAK